MSKEYVIEVYKDTDGDNIENTYYPEPELKAVRVKNGLTEMLNLYWHSNELNMSEDQMVSLFRDENGNPFSQVQNADKGKKLDALSHVLSGNTTRFQMISPETGSPHMVSIENGKYKISDEPIRLQKPVEPTLPKKPGLFARFMHAIFRNHPEVDQYNTAVKNREANMTQYRAAKDAYDANFTKNADFAADGAKLTLTYKTRNKAPETQVPQSLEDKYWLNAAAQEIYTRSGPLRAQMIKDRGIVSDYINHPETAILQNQKKMSYSEIGMKRNGGVHRLSQIITDELKELRQYYSSSEPIPDDKAKMARNFLKHYAVYRGALENTKIADKLEKQLDPAKYAEEQVREWELNRMAYYSGGLKNVLNSCDISHGSSILLSLSALNSEYVQYAPVKKDQPPKLNKTVQREQNAPKKKENQQANMGMGGR